MRTKKRKRVMIDTTAPQRSEFRCDAQRRPIRSVFATSGYANPTFTIVCLALRLAEAAVRVVGRQ
jgi:hypothetical protein